MTAPAKRCKHGVWQSCPDCAAERERRERIAATLLSGMLSNPGRTHHDQARMADEALVLSDYLISKLDEGKPS